MTDEELEDMRDAIDLSIKRINQQEREILNLKEKIEQQQKQIEKLDKEVNGDGGYHGEGD